MWTILKENEANFCLEFQNKLRTMQASERNINKNTDYKSAFVSNQQSFLGFFPIAITNFVLQL